MAQSAIEQRRVRTTREISRCARRLASEHGLDGFTMDQLAEAVGVSRRTLFNYVPGKVDAVLGSFEAPDDDLVAVFLGRGPSGHLLRDLTRLVRSSLEVDGTPAEEVAQVRALIRTDHRLGQALHERFTTLVQELGEAVAEREGVAVDPLTARLLATVTVGLLDTALDESLADGSMTFAQHYDRVFDAAAALFGP